MWKINCLLFDPNVAQNYPKLSSVWFNPFSDTIQVAYIDCSILQTLQDDLDAYQPKVDIVREQASIVAQKVNPLEKEQTEEKTRWVRK